MITLGLIERTFGLYAELSLLDLKFSHFLLYLTFLRVYKANLSIEDTEHLLVLDIFKAHSSVIVFWLLLVGVNYFFSFIVCIIFDLERLITNFKHLLNRFVTLSEIFVSHVFRIIFEIMLSLKWRFEWWHCLLVCYILLFSIFKLIIIIIIIF